MAILPLYINSKMTKVEIENRIKIKVHLQSRINKRIAYRDQIRANWMADAPDNWVPLGA